MFKKSKHSDIMRPIQSQDTLEESNNCFMSDHELSNAYIVKKTTEISKGKNEFERPLNEFSKSVSSL